MISFLLRFGGPGINEPNMREVFKGSRGFAL